MTMQGADEESPEVDIQIDDDPDLNTPPFNRKGSVKAAFQAAQAGAATLGRTPAFAQRFEGEQEVYGFAWKV